MHAHIQASSWHTACTYMHASTCMHTFAYTCACMHACVCARVCVQVSSWNAAGSTDPNGTHTNRLDYVVTAGSLSSTTVCIHASAYVPICT